ncbi:MAG: hypothetical protein LC776_13740 [Acidobacteria bacterium]|nr:hypothetical protein [Acidobacteriota bacterium]
MGTKRVRFSDLSKKVADDENDIARVVVERHPALQDGPVELDVLSDEAEQIVKSGLDVVILQLHRGGEVQTVIMDTDEFNGLAPDMEKVIHEAEAAYTAPPRRQAPAASSSSSSTTDKLDYASLEHAGKPHRGKTTEAEKETVRNNLDAINERLKADGMRTIDLDNPEHVSRYGLEALAKEAGHFAE